MSWVPPPITQSGRNRLINTKGPLVFDSCPTWGLPLPFTSYAYGLTIEHLTYKTLGRVLSSVKVKVLIYVFPQSVCNTLMTKGRLGWNVKKLCVYFDSCKLEFFEKKDKFEMIKRQIKHRSFLKAKIYNMLLMWCISSISACCEVNTSEGTMQIISFFHSPPFGLTQIVVRNCK